MRAVWDKVIKLASFEWLLDGQANGGDIILARSICASILMYLLFIALKHSLDPERTWSFSPAALRDEAHESLAVFGAIFAAIYATLYTRFAAQWNYLAGLYNQLLKAELDLAGEADEEKKKALAYWKASFIEDADELHLSTKRIFVPAIRDWISEPLVRSAFVEGALGGEGRLERLEDRLAKVVAVT